MVRVVPLHFQTRYRCVSGRSRDRQHRRLDGRDQLEVPCVVFDYGFFGGEGDEETLAVQIAKDVGTKMLFAHVVPKKGVMVNHGVTQLVKDIDRFGHKKLCLKSDGEPALVAIQEEVRRQRIDETLFKVRLWEIAGAVQSVAEQIRVPRTALEAKLKAKVPGNHPVIYWLIEHSADLLNKHQKGDDGRTAYHRLRGKSWNHEVVAFVQKVHYGINRKSLTKNTNSTVDGVRGTSWV